MTRPRAADDFATIRARLEELRRENARAAAAEGAACDPEAVGSSRERRLKERREGHPAPSASTIFVKPSGSRR